MGLLFRAGVPWDVPPGLFCRSIHDAGFALFNRETDFNIADPMQGRVVGGNLCLAPGEIVSNCSYFILKNLYFVFYVIYLKARWGIGEFGV